MYPILIVLATPLFFLYKLYHVLLRKADGLFLLQFMGLFIPHQQKTVYWFHCASIGEIRSIEMLIHNLPKDEPVFITTTTFAGKTYLVDHMAQLEHIQYSYLPIDLKPAIRQLLKKIQPKIFIVVETELWPNLFRTVHQSGLPLMLINARISKRTKNAPEWLKKEYQTILQLPKRILAKNPQEKTNFIECGAPEQNIQVVGSLKYASFQHLTRENGFSDHPFIKNNDTVLLASSHEDEEFKVAQLLLELNRPERLLIVPRHPKRGRKILNALLSLTPKVALHSETPTLDPDTKIYIIDTVGALHALYAHVTIVIMGGSFVDKGGHNLLEAVAVGATVLTGPYMDDFLQETEHLLTSDAIVQCDDYQALSRDLAHLLNHQADAKKLADNARAFTQKHSTIVEHYIDAISQCIS